MAALRNKVKLALDEARLLVLGAQILLAFQFQSVLRPGFDTLPGVHQKLKVVTLAGMLLTILLLMWPAVFHQLARRGEITADVHQFATHVMDWALLPFALVLGEEFAAVTHRMLGPTAAIFIGCLVSAAALWFWYGLEFYCRRRPLPDSKERMLEKESNEEEKTPLHDKIDYVLTECRVVIPGAQALLGFQLISMLSEGFDKLPRSSQYTHFFALLTITLSTMLLMTPAAYHRIVEKGEDTDRFLAHAQRMLLSGMATLAVGLSAEFFVVVRRCTNLLALAAVLSATVLAAFYGTWFGYTMYRRRHGGSGPAACGFAP